MWRPNRAQWRIIWIVYTLAFFVSIDWTGQYYPMTADRFITFLVIGGGLVIWRLQEPKAG